MKALVAIVIGAGLAINSYGQAQLTDIVSYEVSVTDEVSGQVLAAGGPWVWEDLIPQEVSGAIAGDGRTIDITCRNVDGDAIYGGTMFGVILATPFVPPMGPMPPSGSGSLTLSFTPDNFTVLVMNGPYFVGELWMLPLVNEPVVQEVSIDIKPGSAKNPFNIRSEGRLPVAILGSAELDVSLVDWDSLKLETIPPVSFLIEDVQADGHPDLVMHFPDKEVASLLTGALDSELMGLELTGALVDGTPISGTDTITVQVKNAKGKSK